MTADVSEMLDHSRRLINGGFTLGARLVPVMHRGANNMVRTARDLAPGGDDTSAAKHYPSTITYDLEIEPGAITIEVGPDRDLNGQAKLGNLFEYGAAERPPLPHLGIARDREEPRLALYLATAGAALL